VNYAGYAKNDGPFSVMHGNQSKGYQTSSLKYPSNLGMIDLHSFVKFGISTQKPIQHVKEAGGLNFEAGNIHTVIDLYIPEQISVTHDVAYKQDESRGAAALAQRSTKGIGEAITGAISGIVTGGTLSALDTLIGSEGALRENNDMIGNAAQYQLLEGPSFRQFSFNYKFVPKNDTEAPAVTQIVKSFRSAMMPNIDYEKFFYKAPQTFLISYHGPASTVLHRFKPCVLTSCEVNYGGEGSFEILRDGTPLFTEMNLTFLELLQVTQDDVEKGF